MKVMLTILPSMTLVLLLGRIDVRARIFRCHLNLTGIQPDNLFVCEPPGYCKPHVTEVLNDSLGVCRCPTGMPGCPIILRLHERCEDEGPDVMYKCENRFMTTECFIQNRTIGQTWGECSCIQGYQPKGANDFHPVNIYRGRDCEHVLTVANGHPCSSFLLIGALVLITLCPALPCLENLLLNMV